MNNNLSNILGTVTSKEWQQFRLHTCRLGRASAYLLAPQSRLPAFQFVGNDFAAISQVSIWRVFPDFREEFIGFLDTDLFQKSVSGEIAHFIYNNAAIPSLEAGTYYLHISLYKNSESETKLFNASRYTQLFEVRECCLDRIEWTNTCHVDTNGSDKFYGRNNYVNTFYFPKCYLKPSHQKTREIIEGYDEFRVKSRKVTKYVTAELGKVYDNTLDGLYEIFGSESVRFISSDGSGFQVKNSFIEIEEKESNINPCARIVTAKMLQGDVVQSRGCCEPIATTLEAHGLPYDEFQQCNTDCGNISNLTARLGKNGIFLEWSGSANHSSFQVYQHDSEGTEPQLLSSVTETLYVHPYAPCTDFKFYVAGVCEDGILSDLLPVEFSTMGAACGIDGADLEVLTQDNGSVSIKMPLIEEAETYELRWVRADDIEGFESSSVATKQVPKQEFATLTDLDSGAVYVIQMRPLCPDNCNEIGAWISTRAKTEPCELSLEVIASEIDCNTEKGSLQIDISNASGEVTVGVIFENTGIYKGSDTSINLADLSAGLYNIIVTDQKCKTERFISLSNGCVCEKPSDIQIVTGSQGVALSWEGLTENAEVAYQEIGASGWIISQSTVAENATTPNFLIADRSDKQEGNVSLIPNLENGKTYRFKVTNKCGSEIQQITYSKPVLIEHCGCCPKCGDDETETVVVPCAFTATTPVTTPVLEPCSFDATTPITTDVETDNCNNLTASRPFTQPVIVDAESCGIDWGVAIQLN